jgi:hypothetical protein
VVIWNRCAEAEASTFSFPALTIAWNPNGSANASKGLEMIGRTDIVLLSPPNFSVADLILRVCRDHWEGCVFQDAESSEVHSLDEPWIWSAGVRSKEFFVYRDSQFVAEWMAKGAHPEKPNSMLHFLIQDQKSDEELRTEVTLVCDRVDADMRSLIESLKSGFLCAMSEQGQAA